MCRRSKSWVSRQDIIDLMKGSEVRAAFIQSFMIKNLSNQSSYKLLLAHTCGKNTASECIQV